MAKSIKQHRKAVQHAFDKAVAIAERGKKRSFHEFERSLWSALLELGRTMVLLFLAHAAARPRKSTYKRGLTRFVMVPASKKMRETELGTLFGKVLFSETYGQPAWHV